MFKDARNELWGKVKLILESKIKELDEIKKYVLKFDHTKNSKKTINVLNDEITALELFLSGQKIVINNKGISPIVRFKTIEYVDVVHKYLGVPKTKITKLIAELFHSFRFITETEKITFPSYLYRDINRFDKKQIIILSQIEYFRRSYPLNLL